MNDRPSRARSLKSLLGLLVVIAIGAHLSAVPLIAAKCLVFVLLLGCYGYFTVQTITKLHIKSGHVRVVLGGLLAGGTIWLMWAVRIPASTGWELPFTLAPSALLESIEARASGTTVSRALGHGTTAEAPSGLLYGVWIAEALAFAAIMIIGAMLSTPDEPQEETDATEETESPHASGETRQAA